MRMRVCVCLRVLSSQTNVVFFISLASLQHHSLTKATKLKCNTLPFETSSAKRSPVERTTWRIAPCKWIWLSYHYKVGWKCVYPFLACESLHRNTALQRSCLSLEVPMREKVSGVKKGCNYKTVNYLKGKLHSRISTFQVPLCHSEYRLCSFLPSSHFCHILFYFLYFSLCPWLFSSERQGRWWRWSPTGLLW